MVYSTHRGVYYSFIHGIVRICVVLMGVSPCTPILASQVANGFFLTEVFSRHPGLGIATVWCLEGFGLVFPLVRAPLRLSCSCHLQPLL